MLFSACLCALFFNSYLFVPNLQHENPCYTDSKNTTNNLLKGEEMHEYSHESR